jgi:Uma2 family endonuclease
MASALPRPLLEIKYEEAAQAYLRGLTLENFMEAKAQATQRKITMESLDLVSANRPDVHVFNEMLVQYPLPRRVKLGQIVPDNMVVVTNEPIRADTSYNLPLEAERPFWVMEYVSKHNKRKDYEASFQKYEQELKVPYYLLFYPDNQELTLFHLKGKKYVSVKPNKHGRYPIKELSLEVALLDGWVRFWYEGELLPLPADLQRDLEKAVRRAEREKHRADGLERRVAELEGRRAALEEELARFRTQAEPPPRRRNGT